MEEKTTDKLECPFCGADPFKGVEEGCEFTTLGGLIAITCQCGAELRLYYKTEFVQIEATKEIATAVEGGERSE